MRFNNRPISLLKTSLKTMFFLGFLVPVMAKALPFNDDLVGGQLSTGMVMRPKVTDSVALGSGVDYVESKETAAALQNPIKGDKISTLNGKRLFEVNCAVCHGWYGDGKREREGSIVGMPSMDLTLQNYKDLPDGIVFSAIHFGSRSGLMPRYGWKLSTTEHWDIVNYVRKFQG